MYVCMYVCMYVLILNLYCIFVSVRYVHTHECTCVIFVLNLYCTVCVQISQFHIRYRMYPYYVHTYMLCLFCIRYVHIGICGP